MARRRKGVKWSSLWWRPKKEVPSMWIEWWYHLPHRFWRTLTSINSNWMCSDTSLSICSWSYRSSECFSNDQEKACASQSNLSPVWMCVVMKMSLDSLFLYYFFFSFCFYSSLTGVFSLSRALDLFIDAWAKTLNRPDEAISSISFELGLGERSRRTKVIEEESFVIKE